MHSARCVRTETHFRGSVTSVAKVAATCCRQRAHSCALRQVHELVVACTIEKMNLACAQFHTLGFKSLIHRFTSSRKGILLPLASLHQKLYFSL